MPHYQPTQDRLLVLQDAAPQLHPVSGLAMSFKESAAHRPNTGTIAEVGPGRRYDDGQVYPLAVQKGQRVMFAPAETLTKVEHDGQEHLMMREQDVFLVLGEPRGFASVRPPDTKIGTKVGEMFFAGNGSAWRWDGSKWNDAGWLQDHHGHYKKPS